MHDSEPPPSPIPGFAPDRFTDLHQVGHGRNAVVFRAWDTQLSRSIVFKTAIPDDVQLTREQLDAIDIDALELPSPLAIGAKIFRERLKLGQYYTVAREGTLLAQVEHPNVIPVLDVCDLHDGRRAIVLPHLEGGAVNPHEMPEDWEDVLEILLAIGRGLAAIHEAGIIHRDFKPANILFDSDGKPVIVDLGLACRFEDDEAMDHWVGTLAYMAPEVHRMERRDVRDDLYAFCVTAFQVFYEVLPFNTRSDRDNGHVRPVVREGGMSTAVHEVIVRGLAPDPDERWPDMLSLLAELEAARDRPAPPERRRLWPAVVAWTAAAASIGLALSVPDVRASECEGLSSELELIWNDDVRDELRDALGTRKAGDGLQDWVSRWITVRGQECEAARISGGDLGPTPCSANLRDRFVSTVHAFERPHLREELSFTTVLAELPAPEHCLDHPTQVDWGHDGPSELRDIDVEVEALVRMGDIDVARGRLDEYMTAAKTVESEHGIARAIFWRGELHRLDGELDDAERDFEQAYLEAGRLGLSALAAEAMMKLVEIAGAREQSALVDAHALAALRDLLEHRPERIAELLRVQGLALGGEQGLPLLAQAVELREEQLEEHPGTRELLSQAQESYARGLLDVGRAREAVELFEIALATHQDEFGHGTWRTLGILRPKFFAHVGLGEWEEAEDIRPILLNMEFARQDSRAITEDSLRIAQVYREGGHAQLAIDALADSRDQLVQLGQSNAAAQIDRALVELAAEVEAERERSAP